MNLTLLISLRNLMRNKTGTFRPAMLYVDNVRIIRRSPRASV
jgi:hypothetical protein